MQASPEDEEEGRYNPPSLPRSLRPFVFPAFGFPVVYCQQPRQLADDDGDFTTAAAAAAVAAAAASSVFPVSATLRMLCNAPCQPEFVYERVAVLQQLYAGTDCGRSLDR
jgi:hypothetical protein